MKSSTLPRGFLSAVLLVMLSLSIVAPVATAQPSPADADTAALRRAYDLLLDRYVHPLDSGALLTAAWHGVQLAGASEQAAPAFSGDRETDWTVFDAAF